MNSSKNDQKKNPSFLERERERSEKKKMEFIIRKIKRSFN